MRLQKKNLRSNARSLEAKVRYGYGEGASGVPPGRRYGATHREAFGVKMDTLMRMQSAYDNAQTRRHEKEIRVRRFHRGDVHPRCPEKG